MDLESLVAIDVHTHAEVSSRGGASLADTLNEASAAIGVHRKTPAPLGETVTIARLSRSVRSAALKL